jgi:outer membrane protein assembly factor BamB
MAAAIGLSAATGRTATDDGSVQGWLNWRGPDQNGTSAETGLPGSFELGGPNHAWTFAVSGRGAPVIAGHRVYVLGYSGEGAELQERVICLDAHSGKVLWEYRFSDFLNDSIYRRYAIGSPTVDAETGNVYAQTCAGLLNCFTADGTLVWQKSLMETHGRLTFPNGRVGAPVIDDDLVIMNAITSSWGADGPARNRFLAFDKHTGELVWSSTPGVTPKDSSFSTPFLSWQNGKRVFYAGTGCGHLVCINARNGEPLWRFRMSIGGVNCSPVLYKDTVIAIHGKENLDTSEMGRMVAIRVGAEPSPGTSGPVVLDSNSEKWRNHLWIFTSSPVLAGNRIYQTVHTGELSAVDADSGKILWEKKYGPDQIHASPLWADGKLYVPMNNGTFHVVRPDDAGPVTLSSTQLAGNCLGAPSVYAGRIYVHTTENLYCFARPDSDTGEKPSSRRSPSIAATSLQVIPSAIVLQPGERTALRYRTLDSAGLIVDTPSAGLEIPELPAGLVFDGGKLRATQAAQYGASVLRANLDRMQGSVRVRVVPGNRYTEDFNNIPLTVPHYEEAGVQMAFPPSHWLSSKPKWEVREREGEMVLAKRLDNTLFQRSSVFISHPDIANYTMELDILSDGNRRSLCSAGVLHQRYLILLKGNAQQIEITSNHERIRESVPFKWKVGQWIRLKSQVSHQADGSTLVRAKAWQRDAEEPNDWLIEYRHHFGHDHGAFGVFGYTPQSRFRVYLDNLRVYPND